MHITVLTGSPHKKGTSALLADRFIAGAAEMSRQKLDSGADAWYDSRRLNKRR